MLGKTERQSRGWDRYDWLRRAAHAGNPGADDPGAGGDLGSRA